MNFQTEIKTLHLKTLQETSGNPQKMDDKTFNGLVESIRRKGWYFAMPDIWEYEPNKYKIISGHHRIRAAIKAGILEQNCNVIIDSNYTDEQAKKDLLESNERHGEPDDILLTDFVTDIIDTYDVDIDSLVDEIGIDDSILNNILIKDDEKDDEVPEVPEIPFSQLGDLYLLNNHRVLCGDSTDEKQVELLMDGNKADLVFTDPPYRMEAEGGSNQFVGKAAKKLGEAIKHLCDFNPDPFLNILPDIFNKNKMNAYIFTNKDLIPDYLNFAVKSGYSFNILFWKKPTAIPLGGTHRPDVEYLLLFRKSAIWNNAVNGVTYSKSLEFGREKGDHPTIKPIALLENEIYISSNKDSLIVDLFLGSGSTLIACEKTNRVCYGMELDEHYIDVIIKRYINYTGSKDNCFLIRDNNKIPLSDIKELNE